MRRWIAPFLLSVVVACGNKPPPPAAVATPSEAITTLGTMQLRSTVLPADSLQADVAQRYGIARDAGSHVVLIMLRDAQGDAIAADGVQIKAQAGLLSDPLQPLPLRAIRTDGFVDYIGTLQAKPPTTVRVQIDAQHAGVSATQTFSRDLYPR